MKVSIITATNRPILDRTIESIKEQSDKSFEWIIVNDGYFQTPISHFRKNGKVNTLYKDIKFVTLKDNYGPSVARNVGFQVSDGEIITYLDSDDTLSPDRVERLLEIFTEYRTELSFSGYKLKEEEETFEFNHYKFVGDGKRYPDFREYIKLLQRYNISIPMGVAHTRKAFLLSGGWQRGIVCGEDGILWRRMVDRVPVDRILFDSSIAGIYYVNSEGQSRTQKRFEMGGFAFDGSRKDNGKYLDKEWFNTFSSTNLFEKTPNSASNTMTIISEEERSVEDGSSI